MKADNRPARGGWADGWYTCTCRECGEGYLGSKRSYECADCAYAKEFEEAKPTTDQIAAVRSRFDLIAHLHRQRKFSEATFGPGIRTEGVLDHIGKEIEEIRADPTDLKEWVDMILLSFDGAWRAGHSPEAIAEAIEAKQTRNEGRTWPDWRTADPNKAIEHDRSADPS